MRKLLALFVTCFCLMQAGGAVAASYEACCAHECKALQCISAGCLPCASAAVVGAEAGSLLFREEHAVPPWVDTWYVDFLQEVWRPPD